MLNYKIIIEEIIKLIEKETERTISVNELEQIIELTKVVHREQEKRKGI